MNLSVPLARLLDGLAETSWDGSVAGLQCRSSAVRDGDLFAAVKGLRQHGLAGLAEALERGAAAVIYEPEPGRAPAPAPVPCVAVPRLSQVLSEIAGRFYCHPSSRMHVVGITGTDGKTSTGHLLAQLLGRLRQACGLIGTLGAGRLEALQATGHTTPDAVRLQAELFDLAQRGAAVAILEVSSHALAQHRCDAVRFGTAVFTVLGSDHLDYHGTREQYAAAKRRLFAELEPQCAVINADDAFGRELVRQLPASVRLQTCALERPADATAREVRATPQGLEFEWHADGRRFPIAVPGLYGRCNVMNLLLSASAAQAQGASVEAIAQALPALRPVPGRLECVAREPWVFVDYAHTPEALEAALQALRGHFGSVAHCVFGCGGERDRGKRPRMGVAAERLAERVTLTDDNPRGESPARIVADIAGGMRDAARARIEHDRAEAIRQACGAAGPDEVVLIAGKGHEAEQVRADGARPFSDHAEVRRLLEAGA